MARITWVGINHYIENEEKLKDFYEELKVGDVVRLVPEPSNFWDGKAVAVYHNFVMRGYISRHETETVHAMATKGMELIGRVVDDIDEEINQVKIVVDSVEAQRNAHADYPRLPKPALGIRMCPHVMYEESSYALIRDDVDAWVQCIRRHSVEDEAVGVALRKIKAAIATYLTLWDRSISVEANVLPRYFDSVLTDLSGMDARIKTVLKDELKQVRRCTALQPKPVQTMQTFCRQMETLDRMYAKENGVYAMFEERHKGSRAKLTRRLEALTEWLYELSYGNKYRFDEDYEEFVHMMYCNGYRAQDLYMVMTHLLLMRKASTMLYGATGAKQFVVNIYGKAQCNFKSGSRNVIG